MVFGRSSLAIQGDTGPTAVMEGVVPRDKDLGIVREVVLET